MIIKLDWDNWSFKKMQKKINEIKKYGAFKKITVFSSPSFDGFHIEIDTFFKLKPKAIFNYRFEFEDDLRRLCLDMLSSDTNTRNVLFNYKIKSKMGVKMKFERKEMFKFYRLDSNTKWIIYQNPESAKSFKVESLQLPLF